MSSRRVCSDRDLHGIFQFDIRLCKHYSKNKEYCLNFSGNNVGSNGTGSGGVRMTNAHMLGLGFIAGIVLFFVLQRRGVIDRLIERLER